MKGENMITEEFDLKEYVNILCKSINGNSDNTWEISFKEAIEYKNKTLKNKKIYKFLPLQNIMNCNESNICEYYKKVNNRNIDNIKKETSFTTVQLLLKRPARFFFFFIYLWEFLPKFFLFSPQKNEPGFRNPSSLFTLPS